MALTKATNRMFSGAVASIIDYGADPTGVADSTTAINTAITDNATTFIPEGTYRITSTIDAINGNKWVLCENAIIKKDFDGVGMTITGGSNFNYIKGDLEITAAGTSYAADTSSASPSPNATGVYVRGNRLIVEGAFYSKFHQGNGFHLESNVGNMNRCVLESLRAEYNGVHGIFLDSTQDDCAVWKYNFYAIQNRQSGVKFDDTWLGRAHEGYIYTESNCHDATTNAGLYIGKLRKSKLFVYAEENINSSPRDFRIGTNCENVEVFDSRDNKSENDSIETCRITVGDTVTTDGADANYFGRINMQQATNNSAKYSDQVIYGNSLNEVGRLRYRGNGTTNMYMKAPSDTHGSIVTQAKDSFSVSISSNGTAAPDAVLSATRTGLNLNLLGFEIVGGTGSPEGAVTAPVGSLFLRTDGGAGTVLYVKESGTGNTGWAAK